MRNKVRFGGKEKVLTLDNCPKCNHGPLDRCEGVAVDDGPTPIKPQDGDFTLCVMCGELLVFTAHNKLMGVRLPSPDQLSNLQKDEEKYALMLTLQKALRRNIRDN